MRLAIVFMLLLLAMVLTILYVPREITLVIGQWAVQTHSVVVLIAVAAVVITMYFLLGIFFFARFSPMLWRAWRKAKKQEKRASSLEEGIRLLVQGDWRKAEKMLSAGAKLSDKPGVYHLGAAQAMHYMGESEASAKLLDKAAQGDAMRASSTLTRARLLESVGDRKTAIAVLQPQVREAARGHESRNYLLQLLCAEGDWAQVLQLIDSCNLGAEHKDSIRRRAWVAVLREAGAIEGNNGLDNFWKRMPRRLRRDDGMLAEYVSACLQLGAGARCEPILRSRLKRKNLPLPRELVMLYGRLPVSNVNKALAFIESLLQRHPENASLLCVAGLFCLRSDDKQCARGYFEASLHLEPRNEIYKVMAFLHEQQGDHEKALTNYRAAISMSEDQGDILDEQILSLLSRGGTDTTS